MYYAWKDVRKCDVEDMKEDMIKERIKLIHIHN